MTILLGADAVTLIRERNPQKPLLLNFAFTAPHAPYRAPQAYLDRYRAIANPTASSSHSPSSPIASLACQA